MSELISIEEARRRVLAEVTPLDTEEIALADALGRVLAEDVESEVDVPPFDSSAMDGFALPPGAEGELLVAGESRAGRPAAEALESGTAMRISTGAVVPAGTGAVVPVERTSERDGRVEVPALPDGANIRRAGEDLHRGDEVLAAGSELRPSALGVLASVGRSAVRCARRPRVTLLATGDELVDPGVELADGQLWSSNPLALAGQITRAGGLVAQIDRVADDADATRTAIARGLESADVVCVSGGVSVGPHDHVKGAFAALQVQERFWGVALKPGKPTWFGVADGGVLAFGLPGNPVSAMVTFHLFVRPALRALQGADPAGSRVSALLTEPFARNPRREEAVRVRLDARDEGVHATPTGPQGSHVLTSVLAADALALIPAGEGEVAAGERVQAELLD